MTCWLLSTHYSAGLWIPAGRNLTPWSWDLGTSEWERAGKAWPDLAVFLTTQYPSDSGPEAPSKSR